MSERTAPAVGPAATGAEGHALRRTARGGALNLLGSGVSAVAQLGAVLVVTRSVGAEAAGGLFAGVSVLLIGAALAQLGTDVSLVRHVAACRAAGRRHDATRVVRTAVVLVVAVGAVLAAALHLVPADLVASAVGGADPRTALVLVLGLPVLALHELLLAVTRGVGSMRPTVLLERLVRPVLQVVLLVAAALLAGGPVTLAWAWVVPWALVLPLSAVAAVRSLRLLDDGGGAVAALTPGPFWRFSATRAGARVCQVALQRADIILVAALAGASAAAVYAAATRFLVIGQLVATAVQQAAQPYFAALHTTGDLAALQSLLRRTTVWSVAVVWPAYLVMGLCAAPLLALFGDGYEQGATSLAVLAAAMLLATAAGPVDVALQMAGRGGTSLVIMLGALAVDVVGCLLLVPRLGLEGAALAWAAAIVLRNLATVWAVSRSPGATAGSAALVRVATLSVLVVALPVGVVAWLDVPLAALAGAVLLTGSAYLALLWRDRARYDLDLVLGR